MKDYPNNFTSFDLHKLLAFTTISPKLCVVKKSSLLCLQCLNRNKVTNM